VKDKILDTLEFSKNIIISPDMDGFTSAKLLERTHGSKVVGTYDKNILVLADGINPEECLFVDCDMNTPEFVSIGNHMRLKEDNMASRSFNPNTHFGISKYSDKFPFATCYLISFATEVETSEIEKQRMAYADSTLLNMEKYSDNMRIWSDRMNHDAISYVIENSDLAKKVDLAFRQRYTKQSFTSKMYGKPRYIQTLNEAFVQEEINHLPLIEGKKYYSDKVGQYTAIRYNREIMSYAEIFTNEYSVTYCQEQPW
jgi:hypothetical protein